MKKDKPFIVILAGPTAVGKTELSLSIARAFNMEIINADSMQVYRYMDIGTAKPSKKERELVRHHLLDVVDPDEDFDAGIYRELASSRIYELWDKGITPLVVGGTGLYIRTLTRGICGHIPKDQRVRDRLKKQLEAEGLKALYLKLKIVDSSIASRIHPNDKQRILRALEVYEITGRPLSEWQREHNFSEEPFRTLKIFLFRDKGELYERIDRRAEKMFADGLVEEAKEILDMGFSENLKPLQSIGYKQAILYINGRISYEKAIESTKKETRHYAKRQFTWFKKEPNFLWVHVSSVKSIERMILRAMKDAKGYY